MRQGHRLEGTSPRVTGELLPPSELPGQGLGELGSRDLAEVEPQVLVREGARSSCLIPPNSGAPHRHVCIHLAQVCVQDPRT